MVVFLSWCCGGVFVFVFLWWCVCGDVFVVMFLWWCFCGGVFAVNVFVVVFLWWCFCGGFLCWCCGGVFVAVRFMFLWWCFCGGVFVVPYLTHSYFSLSCLSFNQPLSYCF